VKGGRSGKCCTAADFRLWRKRMRLSRQKVSILMGISASSVFKYEASLRPVPMIVALAASAIEANLKPVGVRTISVTGV
jgi:transcriptional regulator with XRE-family HTH domain